VAATPAAQGLLVRDLCHRGRPTDTPDTVMITEEIGSGHGCTTTKESEGTRRLLLGSVSVF
jgi:hypothetical protein